MIWKRVKKNKTRDTLKQLAYIQVTKKTRHTLKQNDHKWSIRLEMAWFMSVLVQKNSWKLTTDSNHRRRIPTTWVSSCETHHVDTSSGTYQHGGRDVIGGWDDGRFELLVCNTHESDDFPTLYTFWAFWVGFLLWRDGWGVPKIYWQSPSGGPNCFQNAFVLHVGTEPSSGWATSTGQRVVTLPSAAATTRDHLHELAKCLGSRRQMMFINVDGVVPKEQRGKMQMEFQKNSDNGGISYFSNF